MTEKVDSAHFTQTIHVGSPDAPAEEIQWETAEGFFGQGVFRLPERLGYGRIRMNEVGPTISYVLLELCFNRDVALERPDFDDRRSIIYCRRGGMWLLGESGQKREQREGSLLYCDKPRGERQLFLFRSGERTEWAMFLLGNVGEMLPVYHYPILQVFAQARERGMEFPCITRSPEIARIFERDQPSEETDPKVRRIMLSSKLVSISAILLDKGIGQVQERVRGISAEEREMLEEARSILLQDFNNPPTIAQISRSVGLNETKLKRDFKQFYGLPVYQYLKQAKMERAMELLTDTDLSIREIAFRCGYDSQSQFTAAFRTTYHLAPNDAHKKFRNSL